jgi:hypothetical protein
MLAVAIALLVAFPLVGLLAARWLAGFLPRVGWPLYFLGLNQGWWGHGTGDGWQYAATSLTAVGVVTTVLAVAVGRGVHLLGRRHAR